MMLTRCEHDVGVNMMLTQFFFKNECNFTNFSDPKPIRRILELQYQNPDRIESN